MIPYGRQNISDEDIESVVRVLQSDWLTQGPSIERFENSVASFCGASHAVAVCNATAALHIACLALELGPGDWLWTSPNTFVASANCGLYCGAFVDFVDMDPLTLNMDTFELEKKLRKAKLEGRLPKVVIPVHFAGLPCDMEKIGSLSKEFGFKVIEDASHAIGSRYQNHATGSGTYSDITVFSFHPVKIITTGEGGMVLTNNPDLHQKLMRLRSHGITRDSAFMEGGSEGPWYYQQIDLGFNYRITDLQAALGESQMQRLESFVKRRNELADRYDLLLKELPIQLPGRKKDSLSSFHLYPIRINPEGQRKTRLAIFQNLREKGIGVNVHYIPVHTQPHYRKMGFKQGDFPQSEKYYAEAISLPLYYALSEADQDKVVNALVQTLKA